MSDTATTASAAAPASPAPEVAPDPVVVPTFAQTLLHSAAQKLLTTVAVALAAHGALAASQEGQFVEIGAALALYGAGWFWTWAKSRLDHTRLLALASGAPAVVKHV